MLVKAVGFVIGFTVVAAAEAAILTVLDVSPRGAAWIAAPILAGVAFARVAPGLLNHFSRASGPLWQLSSVRLAAVLCALWLLAVPGYWWLFEPYDYSMDSDDWALMGKTMLFPVALLLVGLGGYLKVVVRQPLDVVAGDTTELVETIPVPPSPNSRTPHRSSQQPLRLLRDASAISALVPLIERHQATIETYTEVARALGGTLTVKGFLFNPHYVVELGGIQNRIDSFEDLRGWFLRNIAPGDPSMTSR